MVEQVRPGPAAMDVSTLLDGLDIVLQPVVEIATGTVVAVEALARFSHAGDLPVEEVIARAHNAGFGYALEAACLRAALARRSDLPDGVRLAINLSPDVLHHPAIARSWDADLDGVIVEVTESEASSPGALHDHFTHLRVRGAQIAVDDVGTGYAGLLRLASVRPDYVKIDRTVVTGVRDSAAQRSVLEALVTFAHRMDATVIGEGVETLDDLIALAEFDVDQGQGWAIGRPSHALQPISRLVVATCQQTRSYLLQRRAGTSVATAYTHGMHAATSALTAATGLAELRAAAAQATAEIGIDAIGVSVLGRDGYLREILSTDTTLDSTEYALSDFPATQMVLQTGNTVEVHLSDPDADGAEAQIMRHNGHASLLMIPITISDQPIGVLEFTHRTHRRWTTHDIANGRGLAAHLAQALRRISM